MIHQVIWLISSAGKVETRFPYLESAAEGDQDEDWCWPLTSLERPEIIYAPIQPAELAQVRWMRPDQPGLLQFQNRLNQTLGRDDLRATWKCIAASDWAKAPDARSLLDFPVMPQPGYMDIHAPGRLAHEIGRSSIESFVADGGKFSVM